MRNKYKQEKKNQSAFTEFLTPSPQSGLLSKWSPIYSCHCSYNTSSSHLRELNLCLRNIGISLKRFVFHTWRSHFTKSFECRPGRCILLCSTIWILLLFFNNSGYNNSGFIFIVLDILSTRRLDTRESKDHNQTGVGGKFTRLATFSKPHWRFNWKWVKPKYKQ